MRLDVAYSLVVFAGSLQWRMGTPVSQVEEERPVFIRLDDFDRLISPVIGEIASWLKTLINVFNSIGFGRRLSS